MELQCSSCQFWHIELTHVWSNFSFYSSPYLFMKDHPSPPTPKCGHRCELRDSSVAVDDQRAWDTWLCCFLIPLNSAHAWGGWIALGLLTLQVWVWRNLANDGSPGHMIMCCPIAYSAQEPPRNCFFKHDIIFHCRWHGLDPGPSSSFPNHKCIIEMNILGSWQNPHIGFLACEIKAIIAWRSSGTRPNPSADSQAI